jgi:PEP-CTERM motif
VTHTALRRSLGHTASHVHRLRGAATLIGLVALGLALSVNVAEASPFVLHVKVSTGGSGGSGSGSAGSNGGTIGTQTPLRSTRITPSPAATGSSKAQVEVDNVETDKTGPTDSGAGSASSSGSPLSGLPLGRVDSFTSVPNTSPFGPTGGARSQATVLAATSNQSGSPIAAASASPASMALLDLGNGEGLVVSKAVGDSFLGVSNFGGWTFDSNTAGVVNTVGVVSSSSGQSAANTTGTLADSQSPVSQTSLTVVVPDLGAGLITFSGSLSMPNVLQGASSGLASIPNPEPGTLLLLGSGVILAARRYARRSKR